MSAIPWAGQDPWDTKPRRKRRWRRKYKFVGNPHRLDFWKIVDGREEFCRLPRPLGPFSFDDIRNVDPSTLRIKVDFYRREVRQYPSGVRRVRFVYEGEE